MPQLVSLKFSQEEMPHLYDPAGVEELRVQDFVVAEREDGDDIAFVAGVEWVSREQLKLRPKPYRRVLRRATDEEKEQFFLRRLLEKKAVGVAKDKVVELRLPMKITTVRYDARDGRLVFLFVSEERVDFRTLVRELSLILKTRIELWQIGVRQEAKVVDGFGVCGLKTCCSTWLPEFRPITIKMAKDQDINLPPTKLAGQCGRLLCCLSYEVDQYKEMARQLMPKGATLEVGGQRGVIIDRNIIRQSYTVQFGDGSTAHVPADQAGEAQVPDQMKRMAGVVARGADGPKRGDRPSAGPADDRGAPPRKGQGPTSTTPGGLVRQRLPLPGQRPPQGGPSTPASGKPADKGRTRPGGATGRPEKFKPRPEADPPADATPPASEAPEATTTPSRPEGRPEGRSGRRRGRDRDRNKPPRPEDNAPEVLPPNPAADASQDGPDEGPDEAPEGDAETGGADARSNEGRRRRRRRGGRGRRGGGGGGSQPPPASPGD